MADRLKEIPAKILEWWNKFTARQKSIIIGITAAVIFTFAILVYVLSRPQYTQLIECSTTSEAAEIIEILESNSIAHRESSSGLKIEVETGDVSAANIALGAAGYVPDDYSIDDVFSSSLTTTASETEKRYKLYLEKKLESDFKSMSMISDAHVSLSIPDQDGTLSAQKYESSAYIQLELNGTFTSANASTLAKATATALGNETTANITIIDSDANLLFAGGDEYSTAGIANSMQELQNQAEAQVANEVKKVLLGTQQYNNIEVSSHLSMDYANYQNTVKEYYANDDRTEGMIASQSTYESESESGVGGTPGTDSNDSDLTTYVYSDYDNSTTSQTETETQYLPNESITYSELAAGAIDLDNSSVSIAAIKYNIVREEDAEAQGLLEGLTWEEYKLANSGDVRIEVDDDFYSLVANTTGISEDNITIIAYESPLFYDEEGLSVSSTTVMSVILFILIIALLAFVVLRSMITSRRAVPEEEELSVEELLQSTPESELEDIDVESKSEIRKMIEKFVDDNPESAAALLRNWLNEDYA
ncbi:MAG: flagellar M-ring protein FliF [Lachnospiraceae bacterium]|nr:flagellar M-ring protein FliF [Lachnospiraceae bacterium]